MTSFNDSETNDWDTISSTCRISASQIIPENLLLHNVTLKSYICQVEIDPIDFCNHNCKWCFTADFRKDKRIILPALISYLNLFCKNGGKSVVFSGGGEPLLYKEIYRPNPILDNKSIIKYLIENGVKVGIITNGLLLKELLHADFPITELSFIRISLDATTEKTHAKLHGTEVSDFINITYAIKNIGKVRGASYTPALGVSYVVDPINQINSKKSDIAAIRDLACNLKVDFVQFKHIHSEDRELAASQMKRIHSFCLELAWDEVEFWVQNYDSPKHSSSCKISQYIQAIGGEKKRFPCCHLFGREEFLDQSSFIPAGKIINNCSSIVCRYNEMNELLSFIATPDNAKKSLEKLKRSIINDGFHPYRYCPTAPNIFSPYNSKK